MPHRPLKIELPSAPIETYLRFIAWALLIEEIVALEEAAGRESLLSYGARQPRPRAAWASFNGQVLDAVADAGSRGDAQVSPVVEATVDQWLELLNMSDQRTMWQEQGRIGGAPTPSMDEHVIDLRTRVWAAVREAYRHVD